MRLQWWNIAIPSPELDEMKAAKYTGTYADLNVYVTMMQNNLLGCAAGRCPCLPAVPAVPASLHCGRQHWPRSTRACVRCCRGSPEQVHELRCLAFLCVGTAQPASTVIAGRPDSLALSTAVQAAVCTFHVKRCFESHGFAAHAGTRASRSPPTARSSRWMA